MPIRFLYIAIGGATILLAVMAVLSTEKMGLGFYLPFSIVLTYSIGSAIRVFTDWKLANEFAEDVGIPAAAGVIVGEALVGVGFAVNMILEAV